MAAHDVLGNHVVRTTALPHIWTYSELTTLTVRGSRGMYLQDTSMLQGNMLFIALRQWRVPITMHREWHCNSYYSPQPSLTSHVRTPVM